jgi:outer membrane autotransporter protein
MALSFRTRLPASVLALMVALASPAYADMPRGCNSINEVPYPIQSTSTPPRLLMAVTDLKVGDKITISASGLPSTGLQLQDSLGNIVLQFGAMSSTVQTLQLTVSTAAEVTLYGYSTQMSHAGPYEVVVSSASCNAPSSNASQGLVKGFLAARINGILLNDPGSTSLLNRSTGQAGPMTTAMAGGGTNIASSGGVFGGAMGLGAGLGNRGGLSSDRIAFGNSRFGDADAAEAGSQSIQFSNSLSQMRRQAAQAQQNKERMALGAGDGGALPLAYETASPWDIWVEGRYSAFDDDAGNLDRDGHVGVLYVGSDYRVTENMIVGALVQFDWAKDSSDVLASKVDGNGWMLGPYMSARIHDNIYFDLRAAWGRSNNDLTLGTTTGGFDTSRWLVKGALAGNWFAGAWRITPSADLAYVEESADAFTNSAGTFVPGQDVSLGRLQFGPEFGYRFAHTADTFIEPFAAIRGVWDFDNPNVAIIDGFVVGPGDFWGRLEGGLNVMTAGGTYVRGSASWDGVGSSDYSGYTLQGTLNVPLN